MRFYWRLFASCVCLLSASCVQKPSETDAPARHAQDVPFEHYSVSLTDSISFQMNPIPGGATAIGCPVDEAHALSCETPRHAVELDPFWIGVHEVTWDEYRLFQFPEEVDVDGITGPTPPYMPMDFGMGFGKNPASSMTQYAAKQYCRWLSLKTGDFYRLPTEVEWEHACRAMSTSAWSFGDEATDASAFAWFEVNSEQSYHPVGSLRPNAWGLYDMHGNVAEWTLDALDTELWQMRANHGLVPKNPIQWPKKEWGRVVRGGSFKNTVDMIRSSSRRASQRSWKMQDPQFPKSIWYLTDGKDVGFRIVRPLRPPSPEEQQRYWDADVAKIQRIHERQSRGER